MSTSISNVIIKLDLLSHNINAKNHYHSDSVSSDNHKHYRHHKSPPNRFS